MIIFDYTISVLNVRDIWILSTAVFCFLIMLDDFFVDILALFVKAKPNKLDNNELKKMNSIVEKKVAILIANWHEDAVLEKMVSGNVNNINYLNYEILLGVYPNDTATLLAAKRAENKFSNVRVIVNTLDGPTSKGQMINRMIGYVEQFNLRNPDNGYELIVIQDAEDVIHRFALKLMNFRSLVYDFIQIPVFSLAVPLNKLTAGIYVDEFTESHTKNLLVRNSYDAGVPSAGVGTAVSRQLVMRLLKLQGGYFLNEKTLTEDYYLGLTCYDLGVKSHFSCEYFEYENRTTGKMVKEYIATREFFPQKIKASIKQKTRWSLGICLQSLEHKREKCRNFFGTYFLWRDRKGLISAPLFVSATLFIFYFLMTFIITQAWPVLDQPYYSFLLSLIWINLFLSMYRILQRSYLVSKVYGAAVAVLVPIRWVLSNFINTTAMFYAIYQWVKFKINDKPLTWSKTDHIIPTGFGESTPPAVELILASVPLPNPIPPVSANEIHH